MLVLSRKLGEGIVIGDDVIVTVIESKGGNIKIGIEAPKDKKIYRRELYNRIMEENRSAANWDMVDLEKLCDNLTAKK